MKKKTSNPRLSILKHQNEHKEELRVAEENRAKQKISTMFRLKMLHKNA